MQNEVHEQYFLVADTLENNLLIKMTLNRINNIQEPSVSF